MRCSGNSGRCYFNARSNHDTCAGHASGAAFQLFDLEVYIEQIGIEAWIRECNPVVVEASINVAPSVPDEISVKLPGKPRRRKRR